ncbi:MAG: hypothetical protein WBJ81_01875 [Rickettsiales bacterium]
MKDAKRNNYKNILIFEDDIKISDPINFNNKVKIFLLHLPQTFDLAFLGLEIQQGSLNSIGINGDVNSVTPDFMAFGIRGYIVSQKGLDKFLSYDTYDSYSPDIFVWNHARNSNRDTFVTGELFECYVSSENLIYQSFDFPSLVTEMGRI